MFTPQTHASARLGAICGISIEGSVVNTFVSVIVAVALLTGVGVQNISSGKWFIVVKR